MCLALHRGCYVRPLRPIVTLSLRLDLVHQREQRSVKWRGEAPFSDFRPGPARHPNRSDPIVALATHIPGSLCVCVPHCMSVCLYV